MSFPKSRARRKAPRCTKRRLLGGKLSKQGGTVAELKLGTEWQGWPVWGLRASAIILSAVEMQFRISNRIAV